MISPGKSSTEHGRAWRAEAAGFVILALGSFLVFVGLSPERTTAGLVLVGIGAALIAYTAGAYAHSRGNVKAAAVRRPADEAPRRI